MRHGRGVDDPADGNDWHEEEVTHENAEEHRALETPYHNKIARTIQEVLDVFNNDAAAMRGY